MAKFRKKPVVIEAIEWTGDYDTLPEHPEWFEEACVRGTVIQGAGPELTVCTLEGNHTAIVGDMIIQGVKGELYPCKADIFALTYEAVE